MDDAERPAVRFAVVGVAHPHAVVLTGELLAAGAVCTGWTDTGEPHDGLFPLLYPDLAARDAAELLGDRPDLVVVAAVPDRRAAFAVDAVRAGADVLVAKPPVTSRTQIDLVEAAIEETGGRWWVAYTEHFTSPAVIRADALVAEGRIGTVRHVLGLGPHRLGDDRPAWFHDPARSGAMPADLASHQIHHAARLLGTTDLIVRDARVTPAPDRPHPPALAEILLEGGTGSAYIRVDWLTPDGLDSWGDVRLLITGDRGTIEVRPNVDPGGAAGGEHLIVVDADGTERLDCSHDATTWAATLLADVRNRTEHLLTTEHCLAVTRIAQACADATT